MKGVSETGNDGWETGNDGWETGNDGWESGNGGWESVSDVSGSGTGGWEFNRPHVSEPTHGRSIPRRGYFPQPGVGAQHYPGWGAQ